MQQLTLPYNYAMKQIEAVEKLWMTNLTTNQLIFIIEPVCFFGGQTQFFQDFAYHSSRASQAFYFLLFPVKRGDAGFIDLALRKGATGVVTTKAVAMEKQAIFHVTFFGVKDVRKALTQTTKFLFPQSPPLWQLLQAPMENLSLSLHTNPL